MNGYSEVKDFLLNDENDREECESIDINKSTENSPENKKPSFDYGKQGWIVQEYIKCPLLIDNRKFDIRCYVLIINDRGRLEAYLFKDGYIRTACKKVFLFYMKYV
jgi:hypothetical protein